MKPYSNRLLLALACGVLVCPFGCNNTKHTSNANTQTNNEKSDRADVPGDGSVKPATEAQDNVPHRDPEFEGKIGKTFRDSRADPKLILPLPEPADAPNILLVLIDAAGFGASSTFGGPCHTPGLTKLAENGLRYNRFHTTLGRGQIVAHNSWWPSHFSCHSGEEQC